MSTLDLSGADLKGFEPLPAGAYNCTIFAAEMQETQGGPDAKMPAGTPKINVQFKVEDEPFQNRRLFSSYVIPPEDYAKAPQLKGMLVRFLTAIGYDEKKIVSGKFNLDLEDFGGRGCVVVVKVQQKYNAEPGEMTNQVSGVKPAGSGAASAASSLI